MNIINIENSPLRNRRYRIYLLNGERYDVGFKKCKYYIDNGNKDLRKFYYTVFDKNAKHICSKLIPCQLLYETFILNGATTNIIKNINFYNNEILRSF
jgi:hypothetical protein